MSRALSIYATLMRTHPAKTQILTTGTLMLTGDVIAQKAIEKCKSVDVTRAGRFFVIGVGLVGPVIRKWYMVLERIVGPGGTSVAVKKVLFDQLLFSPAFIPCFLVCLGFLQQRQWADIQQTVRRDYVPILVTSYMIWPAAQIINFRFVPLQYRVPFASAVALVWNTYLAWKANRIPTS